MRFPESWSSTSLANKRCSRTAQENYALDNAFALIEGHPADCAFGGSPEKSLNLDEGVNHIVEGLETDCPPQIAPLEIQAAPLPQGEKGLTFETEGEIIIFIERIAILSRLSRCCSRPSRAFIHPSS